MHVLSDYLQPLTYWIYQNPSWALLITFLISLSESLAIIGSIIPGSVTMTAIGILAGSGMMRIDLTLLAATLGAIAGDSSSYVLGYVFRHRLPSMWPFSRYPHWLLYGKAYFAKHGGKSVLIGRFIGPLRAIIPVIAGMMHMNHWQFLLANVLSAIGWSVIYIIPGVLIGSAGSDLSAESASRLFMFVIVALIVIWMLSVVLKWLFKRLNTTLEARCNQFWAWSKQHKTLDACFSCFTPNHEFNHYHTVLLVLYFFIGLLLSMIITLCSLESSTFSSINEPVYFFFQSFRTNPFDAFFITISLFVSTASLASLALALLLMDVVYKNKQRLTSWISLCGITMGVIFGLNALIDIPDTQHIFKYAKTLTYPDTHLCFAAATFSFIVLMSNRVISIPLITLLILTGLGTVYLGKNSLTNVFAAYLIGLTLCLGQWLYYRKMKSKKNLDSRLEFQEDAAASVKLQNRSSVNSNRSVRTAFFVYLAVTILSYPFCYGKLVQTYSPFLKQYVLTSHVWWHQSKPVLPLYTTNRIGKPVSPFNLQYSGPIESLEQALVSQGWQRQDTSFFHSLLRQTGTHKHRVPKLMSQLYLNRKPSLLFTYDKKAEGLLAVIRLWRSNYHLKNYPQPIWLGRIEIHSKKRDASSEINDQLAFSLITRGLEQEKAKHLTFKLALPGVKPVKQSVNLLLVKLPQDPID